MQKEALEKTCYVAGGGAFGVFIRWLQTQVAFNDEGLPDASIFNVLVPLVAIAAAIVFFRFLRQYRKGRYYFASSFTSALRNEGLVYSALRWIIGGIMCLGALLLFLRCETDKNAGFFRVLAGLGLLSGAAFPIILREANEEIEPRLKLVCAASVAPMLLFAFWLVTCYKVNSINGVVWAYGVEVVACCVLLLAFFRVAGFAFSVPDGWSSLFLSMMGAFLAIMCLADERYMGMQLMLFAAALMLIFYTWVLIVNMRRKKVDPIAEAAREPGGFERL